MSEQAAGPILHPTQTRANPVQSGILQRQCACGNHTTGGGECEECKKKREEGMPQRASYSAAPTQDAPPVVNDVLRTPGQPLDAPTRSMMEPRFGEDFSQVRVHTDSRAAESASAVNALAYTVGSHIVFGRGQYAPQSSPGRNLLAHELTHTVQQAGVSLPDRLAVQPPGGVFEQEAERAAESVMQGPADWTVRLPERNNTGGHSLSRKPLINNHAAAGRTIQRQPTRTAKKTQEKEGDLEAAQKKTAAIKALDGWERSGNLAIDRYRNWLTHNMILFLSDVLQSGKGSEAIAKIKGGFAKSVTETALGNLGQLAAVEIGARAGGRTLARLFLSLRTAKVFGGVIGFIVSSIVGALIGDLLDKSNQIIQTTSEQMDKLVTGFVNPTVNDKQHQFTIAVQDLRNEMEGSSLSAKEWDQILIETTIAQTDVSSIFLNQNDESLYRELALSTGVYSKKEAPAEQKSPEKLPGAGTQFEFTMQQRQVKTGKTTIHVPQDNGTVIISSSAHDCIEQDGEYDPVDIKGPDAAPSWKLMPPAREYTIDIFENSFWHWHDKELKTTRTFQVGQKQYGIWYNVPKGTYHPVIRRIDYHPVALCGECEFWVSSG